MLIFLPLMVFPRQEPGGERRLIELQRLLYAIYFIKTNNFIIYFIVFFLKTRAARERHYNRQGCRIKTAPPFTMNAKRLFHWISGVP